MAGYEVAGAALRPVERMRALAERITESELSERLPVGAPRDEIAALGRTLNAMLDRLEAAVARERRLVSDASHELRTPLTHCARRCLALRGERDAGELRAALESASEEAERMSRLADDLLVKDVAVQCPRDSPHRRSPRIAGHRFPAPRGSSAGLSA